MNRTYPPTGQYLPQHLDEIFARAVEGDVQHAAIEDAVSDISVTLAAGNTPVDTAVAFALPFAVTPAVLPVVTGAANASVYINALAINVGLNGFTLRVASGAAQTITLRWLAYGRRQ